MPEIGTTTQIIAQLNKDYPIHPAWASQSLTFSFSTAVPTDTVHLTQYDTFSAFNTTQKTAARQALAAFSDVIAVDFNEIGGQKGNGGEIRFMNFMGDPNNADAYWPGAGIGGDVHVSVSPVPEGWPDLGQPFRGGHAFLTFLHEIGHAMGLHHAGDYNGGSPSYAVDALFAQDTEQFTVMSYFQSQDADNGNNHFDPDGVHHFAQTLMLYDIAALQATYGANLTTRAGATVYGFNSNIDAASPYNFASNAYPVVCIYDAGGRDRIDFSGFTGPTRINLAQGSFSNTQDMAQNVSIAFGTVIEDATGGLGADEVLGNRVGNVLRGLDGADLLAGYGGADRLFGGDGNDTLAGATGDDTLTGGHGADVFVLDLTAQAGAGVDVIADFGHAADQFDLLGMTGTLTAAAFHSGTKGRAHDLTDRIIYNSTTGQLYFDADGTAAHGVAAVQIALLTNAAGLDWTDFTLA